MDHIKTILTAIDFSHYTQKTLEFAATMARQMSAKLVVINVINQRDVNIMNYTFSHMDSLRDKMSIDGWMQDVKKERTEAFEKAKADLGLGDVSHEFKLRVGFPFEELMKSVKEEKVDLVVMGAKGKSDLADFLVGSVANKMFRKCPVPIVSVRIDV